MIDKRNRDRQRHNYRIRQRRVVDRRDCDLDIIQPTGGDIAGDPNEIYFALVDKRNAIEG